MPGPLSAAASRLTGDPAAVLLDAAALAVAYRRGGAPPRVVGSEPERAPADARRRPTPRASALLEGVLGADVNLLRFWCETAAEAGLVAPDEQLPALLDRAVQLPALRPAVGSVLGERGRWLARMQPRWAGAIVGHEPDLGELDPAGWQFGDPSIRLGWLRAARRTDPAAGLAALAGTWPKESGPDRAMFLAVLARGLGAADEAFLEAALDDRVQQVRAAAAELLATLPGSGYLGRMRQRATSFVRSEGKPGRNRAIIEVPDRLDPAAVRDGITDVPPGRPISEQARTQWWLEQIVGATPLDTWQPLLGPAQQAVRTQFDDVAQPAVRAGWAWAAVRQRNREWAFAVLGTGTRLRVEELLPLLDAEQLATILRERLRVSGPADVGLLARYLSGCPAPWPEPVAADVLSWLLAAIPGLNPLGNQATPLLELISFRFPLADDGLTDGSTAARVAAAAAGVDDNFWRSRLASVARTIRQRTQIHKELQ